MKNIFIKTTDFFELLRLKDTSMWDVFAKMIDGEEKEIIFLNENEKVIFSYLLPKNIEKLNDDKEKFAKEYAKKFADLD